MHSPLRYQFEAKYVEGSANAAFVAPAGEAKCNLCHYGTTKKNRNDYGMALSTLLKKDDYSSARVAAEPENVEKEIYEAFQKVEEMNSTGGKTFGELLNAGQLPGTAPAE